MSQKQIRLGIIGGRRGATFNRSIEILKENVQLTAFCDLKAEMFDKWKEDFPDIKMFTRYEDMLDCSDVDAIFLATPLPLHAAQAVQALRSGKHVLSEVIASTTIEEGWELVEAVEQTGLTYMMAENYCFRRPVLMVQNMVEANLFGDLTFAEGGYIHDTRNLAHYQDGQLTWRGNIRHTKGGNVYPTHSLGPIAKWLNINGQDGDEFESITTLVSKGASTYRYFRELFGDNHPGADPSFWSQGDTAVSLIKTRNDVLVQLRYDTSSPRPHNMSNYALQGTGAAYLGGRHEKEDPLIWIQGRSPGLSPHPDGVPEPQWEQLWQYAEEFEHPLWKRMGSDAIKAGHGGGDLFVLQEFASAIIEKRRPYIDVYDAVTWSSVRPLSIESASANGTPVKFVNFCKYR